MLIIFELALFIGAIVRSWVVGVNGGVKIGSIKAA
jgi:hypothetical protein